MAALGQDLDEVLACEQEPGLGNGGLGRLAACYLDSLATLGVRPSGTGSVTSSASSSRGIADGWRVEKTDNWLAQGNPWRSSNPS